MIIQSTNYPSSSDQTLRRVGDDVPQSVSDASNAKSSLGVTDDTQQPSSEELSKAADFLNQAIRESSQSLEFEFTVDSETNKTVLKVRDAATGGLVRQIPSKEALAIARSIDQFQHSLLLNQKV